MVGETMEINIANIEKECSTLKKNIDSFYDNVLAVYNELNWVKGYWDDYHARLFFTNVNSEKMKVVNTYNELKSVSNIYESMVERYKSIGNKIQVNLEEKDNVLAKFNNFYDKVNELISLYNGLNLRFCVGTSVANRLYRQKQDLLKIKASLNVYKERVKTTFETLEEIERDINYKISNTSIEEIEEANISEFM